MSLNRYAIWDKTSPIITPIGEILSAQDWIDRYPIAGLDNVVVVCAAGEINGSFFGTLGQMVQMYEAQGCDFSEATTDIEKLEAIEAFEDFMNAPPEDTGESLPEERIAAALEYNNLLNSPVVNSDDPDED